MSSTENNLRQLLDEARREAETLSIQQPPPSEDDLAARAAELRAAEQQAQQISRQPTGLPYAPSLGPVAAGAATLGNNMEQRLLGGQNTLLMGLKKLGIELPPGPFNPGMANPDVVMEENRRRALALQDLNAALKVEEPFGSNVGDALTFVAEAAIGGKPFKHANPTKQFLGRTAQESAVGGAYAGMTVGMNDAEKESLIAYGLVTGAIAPHAIGGIMKIGGKTMSFSADRLERIAKLVKAEKMFNTSGLLTFSEMTGHRGLAKIEAALDNIPFLGLGRKRDQQKLWFQKTGESLVDRFGRGRVPTRGDTTKAKERLGEILYNTYHRNYETVHRNYEGVAWRLDELPIHVQPKVRPTEMQRVAEEMLEAELRLPKGGRSDELITTLRGYLDNPQALAWKDAVKLLRRIKEQAVVQMDKAAKKETTREYGAALTQLEIALYNDMRVYAEFADKHVLSAPQKGETILQQLDAANESFRRLVLPFHKSEVLADVTRGEDFAIDNIVAAFLDRTASIKGRPYPVGGRPGSKRAFDGDVKTRSPMDDMDIIPPEAQDIVRGLMMREAFERGTKGGAFLDPAAFKNELSSMQKHWDVVFTKEQQSLLEGYVTLAQTAQRSMRSASDMGAVTGGFGAIGLAGFGLGASSQADEGGFYQNMLPYIGTVWGARFLLGSKAGNSALRMAAKVDDWSTKEGRMVLELTNAALTRYLTQHYNEIYEGIKGFPMEQAPDMFAHPVQ